VGRLLQLATEILRTLGAYVAGQFKVALILSLIYAAGFAICRVPFWGLVAFVCGFLNFIPFIGSLIGLGLALFVSWINSSDVYRLSGVLAVWVVAQGLEGFWITPRILGRRLQLRPIVIFLAILAGGLLFGPFGVLLAAPVAAVTMVVWRFFSGAENNVRASQK